MFPWTFYRDLYYRFPFSGDVAQRIEPEIDWFFGKIPPEAGDAEVEKAVFSQIAAYGKQLGILTDVVLALADQLPGDGLKNHKALEQLQAMRQRIEKIKADKKEQARANAKKWLDKLAESDSDGLRELLRQYG